MESTDKIEATTEVSPIETVLSSAVIKEVLGTLEEQRRTLSSLVPTVRKLWKDVDRMEKEIEKSKAKKARKPSVKKENREPSGITMPASITPKLAKFLGIPVEQKIARTEVTKAITKYVKDRELQDPENRRRFLLNDPKGKELKELLGNPDTDVTYFNLQTYLKVHFIPTDKSLKAKEAKAAKAPSTPPTPTVEAPVETETATKKVVKKKVLRKKKVEPQLEAEGLTA